MKSTTEVQIETYNLELLETLGYGYLHGPDIAPEGSPSPDNASPFRVRDTTNAPYLSPIKRTSFSDVILRDRLSKALARINPHIPTEQRQQAQRELQNIASPDLITNNETFHRYLTEGITVEYQRDGENGYETKGEQLWLIDWENPENNNFLAVNHFTIIEDNHNRRPDIILFINGIPLVVIELKNATDAKASLQAAYNQL